MDSYDYIPDDIVLVLQKIDVGNPMLITGNLTNTSELTTKTYKLLIEDASIKWNPIMRAMDRSPIVRFYKDDSVFKMHIYACAEDRKAKLDMELYCKLPHHFIRHCRNILKCEVEVGSYNAVYLVFHDGDRKISSCIVANGDHPDNLYIFSCENACGIYQSIDGVYACTDSALLDGCPTGGVVDCKLTRDGQPTYTHIKLDGFVRLGEGPINAVF